MPMAKMGRPPPRRGQISFERERKHPCHPSFGRPRPSGSTLRARDDGHGITGATMSSMAISWIVFSCVLGGALLGMLLRAVLPAHHLSAESKDLVKLAMGLIGTMAALVIGLLVASAKSSYDTQKSEFEQMSANVSFL